MLKRNYLKPVLVMMTLALNGCINHLELGYSTSQESELTQQIFALSEKVKEKDILELNDEIRAVLDSRIKPGWAKKRKLKALRELLFHESETNIVYNAYTSRTAMETFYAASGNCLSMTNLFIASARHIGLDAFYQTVEVEPTWDHQGLTMIRYEHIIASGRISPGETYVVDFLPEFVIGESNSLSISDERAQALIYNNLGAESVVEGKYDQAISYLAMALDIYPDFSDAWNNMGAALRRLGKLKLAEFSFRKSIVYDQYNYSALSNLARHYKHIGEPGKADKFVKRVNNYRARNPYFHYFLSKLYLKAGDLSQGQLFVEASIKLKKDEPDFYTLLAEIHKALGNEDLEKVNLALAKKYREERVPPPPRVMGHRIWIKIGVN